MSRTGVDVDVLERAKAGCQATWRGLVDQHMPMVHAICRSYGLDVDSAREVNQTVWLRLVEHLSRIRDASMVGAWIAATTRAECVRPCYAAARSGRVAAELGGLGGLERGGDDIEQVAGPADDSAGDRDSEHSGTCPQRLAAAFGRLGSRCQRLLRLLASVPRLRHDHVSAALDVGADQVDSACAGCLERLGAMADADPPAALDGLRRLMTDDNRVPDDWWDATEAAFAWLTLDATYAELVYDSVPRLPSTPASQSLPDTVLTDRLRRVRFAAGTQGVELSLDAKQDEVLLTGRVARRAAEGVWPVPVVARWPNGSATTQTDDRGSFRFHDLPVHPLSVQIAADTPFKTGWVLP